VHASCCKNRKTWQIEVDSPNLPNFLPPKIFLYGMYGLCIHYVMYNTLFIDQPLASAEAGTLYNPVSKLVEAEKQPPSLPKQLSTIEKLSVSCVYVTQNCAIMHRLSQLNISSTVILVINHL